MTSNPILLAAFSLALAQPALSQVNMALLGDSIIDDYLGPSNSIGTNTNLAAGSFGQILADTRGADINFGAYKAPTANTADAWDSIRNFGYEYNWATAGGTASAQELNLDFNGPDAPGYAQIPIASNLAAQVAGLAPSISSGDVDTAVISVGPNDFFYHSLVIDTASGGFYPAPDGQLDQTFTNLVADSILEGIDTLQAAGDVDIILGLLAKRPGLSEEENTAIDTVNNRLLTEATEKGVVVLDFMEWTISGENVDPITQDVTIGDVVVEYGSVASISDMSTEGDGAYCTYEGLCPLDSHAFSYLAEDGRHLNTLMQGMLANEILTAMNTHFDHDIDLLSDSELLGLVGVSEVPVPAAAWLFMSALLGLVGIKRRN
ncbi:VPLPA-CTERM sorting domain-containing protein [Oceanicoccus sagamiensis]|uniref:SGNH hydrolase-type esterase domain-containing protein n=1 Tax=Oceanicoccus sagamiensis TaxID=716816 RepID=A0A1X9NIB9_9GAMM|nr:VPLPA-CTERM sorting domain-containing protein [Oceanicoccus sagamiensis]ARN75585.1 hypothetical protein BST96_16615 [Oceanicoccus sagamiensis]